MDEHRPTATTRLSTLRRCRYLSLLAAGLPLAACLLLGGCATPPPRQAQDACAIFQEYPDWYAPSRSASQRWGVPIHVLLAIMHQESSFRSDAKPPRTKILWILPGPRPTSAYGYAQALDNTWDDYVNATGKSGADRDEFADAVDFIGWYVQQNVQRNRVASSDAYRQYLAYHEGMGGYARGTYQSKPWLIQVARKVQNQASRYQGQLGRCQAQLARL